MNQYQEKKENVQFLNYFQRQQKHGKGLTSDLSANYQKYQNFFKDKCSKINPSDYQVGFEQNQIIYNSDIFLDTLSINIIHHTYNYEVMKVNVRYGCFEGIITLLNVEGESCSHHLCEQVSGSFGKVYRAKYVKEIAIKSIELAQNNFQTIFVEVIKQYFLLKIASALRAAPVIDRIYGFDIVIFKDSIQFSMQMCNTNIIKNYQQFQHASSELIQNLYTLHEFKIVHNDIKPQNIAFSPYQKAFVYLDFGLSRLIKQGKGSVTLTSFVGSIEYCSKDMRELYMASESGYIDLYYNDIQSLINTFDSYRSEIDSNTYCSSKEGLYTFREEINKFYQLQILLLSKYALYQNCLFSLDNGKFFIENSYFLRNYERQLLIFMRYLPQGEMIKSKWKSQLKSQKMVDQSDIFQNHISIKRLPIHHENISSQFFSRFNAICSKGLNQNSLSLEKDFKKNNEVNFLLNATAAKHYKLESYLEVLIRYIEIGGTASSSSEKIEVCKVFATIYLPEELHLTSACLYKRVIMFGWDYATNNFQSDKFFIFIHSIRTVVILQLLEQSVLKESFYAVFNHSCLNFIEKSAAAFQFIISLQFINEKFNTKYNYEVLFKEFIIKMRLHLINVKKHQALNDDEVRLYQSLKQFIELNLEAETQQDDSQSQIMKEKSGYQFSNRAKLVLLQLQKKIESFIKYHRLRLHQYETNSFYNQDVIGVLKAINRNHNRLDYHHFALYQLSFRAKENLVSAQIYEIFTAELGWLDIVNTFNIEIYRKLIYLENKYKKSRTHFLPGVSYPIQKDLYQMKPNFFGELFNMLEIILKNRQNMHKYLNFLFKFPWLHHNRSFSQYFQKFLRQNQEHFFIIKNAHNDNKFILIHQNFLQEQMKMLKQVLWYMFYLKIKPQNEALSSFRALKNLCQSSIEVLVCFKCKGTCLFELKIIQFYILFHQKRNEEAFNLIVDCLIFSMKNNDFILQRNKSLNYIIELVSIKTAKLDDFIYSFVKMQKDYFYCFNNIGTYNVLACLYFHLYEFYPNQELLVFMKNIIAVLSSMISDHYIDFFCQTMTKIVLYLSVSHIKQTFKVKHDEIAKQLIKNVVDPYVSLYLNALLEIKHHGELDYSILLSIARFINSVDKYSKQMILSKYYAHFAYYITLPQRKARVLFTKHIMYYGKVASQKNIWRQKISGLQKIEKNKQVFRIIKNKVVVFHKNIANLK